MARAGSPHSARASNLARSRRDGRGHGRFKGGRRRHCRAIPPGERHLACRRWNQRRSACEHFSCLPGCPPLPSRKVTSRRRERPYSATATTLETGNGAIPSPLSTPLGNQVQRDGALATGTHLPARILVGVGAAGDGKVESLCLSSRKRAGNNPPRLSGGEERELPSKLNCSVLEPDRSLAELRYSEHILPHDEGDVLSACDLVEACAIAFLVEEARPRQIGARNVDWRNGGSSPKASPREQLSALALLDSTDFDFPWLALAVVSSPRRVQRRAGRH
jgi:hypothetical protein